MSDQPGISRTLSNIDDMEGSHRIERACMSPFIQCWVSMQIINSPQSSCKSLNLKTMQPKIKVVESLDDQAKLTHAFIFSSELNCIL